ARGCGRLCTNRPMGLAFRESGEGPVALLVHGYPNSSYLWRDVMPAVADAGWRAVAPDLAGYGDSGLEGATGTWEEHVEALGAFVAEHALAPVALVVHDWGGLIGLRWACEHPDQVRALAIMSTGFFPDGKWHGMARAMRAGQVDEMIDGMTRDGFAGLMQQAEPNAGAAAVEEYFKGFSTPERRRAGLELYKSGDFEKLEPYRGRLAALGVPTLVLWGAHDDYAPVASAHRFKKEIPHAEVVVLEDAGHFVMEDDPARVGAELARFLSGPATM
ncbi:MAG: alpha/beta fold hydrolase, partial [Solirubrobacterales bacterium]|nr:alpha/beta fold hydrolase [Solirubrobacterales bacterium]